MAKKMTRNGCRTAIDQSTIVLFLKHLLSRNYLLKIPDPTKQPSTPSCISREQSAGVAKPPAAKFTTGSRPKRAVSFKRSRGA